MSGSRRRSSVTVFGKEDMKMYKKILVTLDGSELAEQIIPHVRNINNGGGSEVHLLRVAMAHTLPGMDPVEGQVEVVKEARNT